MDLLLNELGLKIHLLLAPIIDSKEYERKDMLMNEGRGYSLVFLEVP
jgi:hypothetical protein